VDAFLHSLLALLVLHDEVVDEVALEVEVHRKQLRELLVHFLALVNRNLAVEFGRQQRHHFLPDDADQTHVQVKHGAGLEYLVEQPNFGELVVLYEFVGLLDYSHQVGEHAAPRTLVGPGDQRLDLNA